MIKNNIKNFKFLEDDDSIFTIAEIGINHEGNIDKCAEMIKAASEAGADAVKLQTIDPDENYSKDTISYKLFKKAWLTPEDTEKMFVYARSLNIEPFTTVGDFKTLEWVKGLKPEIYKISSGLIDHLPLIKKIGKFNKPIIISSGTASEEEVDIAINNLIETDNKNIVLLHCVSSYPTPFDQTNLKVIRKMINKYSFPIGYSDHALGYKAVLAATILGSRVIEKHFTLDTNKKGFDHGISLDPNTFKQMIKDINFYKKMLGKGSNWLSTVEIKNKKWMRRIIVANKQLKKGHIIKEQDILFMRHTEDIQGLRPAEFYNIIGKVLCNNINTNFPILKEDLYDK